MAHLVWRMPSMARNPYAHIMWIIQTVLNKCDALNVAHAIDGQCPSGLLAVPLYRN